MKKTIMRLLHGATIYTSITLATLLLLATGCETLETGWDTVTSADIDEAEEQAGELLDSWRAWRDWRKGAEQYLEEAPLEIWPEGD